MPEASSDIDRAASRAAITSNYVSSSDAQRKTKHERSGIVGIGTSPEAAAPSLQTGRSKPIACPSNGQPSSHAPELRPLPTAFRRESEQATARESQLRDAAAPHVTCNRYPASFCQSNPVPVGFIRLCVLNPQEAVSNQKQSAPATTG